MIGKNFLNFHGSNVFATRDDDILCAILEFNIPIRVPDPQITGTKPSVDSSRKSCFFVAVIAHSDIISTDHDFAECLPVRRDILAVRIDYADGLRHNITDALTRIQT